jgi:hypothetical protein
MRICKPGRSRFGKFHKMYINKHTKRATDYNGHRADISRVKINKRTLIHKIMCRHGNAKFQPYDIEF